MKIDYEAARSAVAGRIGRELTIEEELDASQSLARAISERRPVSLEELRAMDKPRLLYLSELLLRCAP